MTDTAHRAFFGDAEHSFRLTPELIVELEAKTGTGIGALCRRLFAGPRRQYVVGLRHPAKADRRPRGDLGWRD
jgi:hypothetical protein